MGLGPHDGPAAYALDEADEPSVGATGWLTVSAPRNGAPWNPSPYFGRSPVRGMLNAKISDVLATLLEA
jgi:hypothetical protein